MGKISLNDEILIENLQIVKTMELDKIVKRISI